MCLSNLLWPTFGKRAREAVVRRPAAVLRRPAAAASSDAAVTQQDLEPHEAEVRGWVESEHLGYRAVGTRLQSMYGVLAPRNVLDRFVARIRGPKEVAKIK